jgi:pectate lyase
MPAIHSVSTNAELVAALKTAEQGDVISLASGNYGELTLKGQAGFDMNFAGGVAIVSADPTDPAVLSGLDIRGASNLTFLGIKFDYTFADGDRAWTRPFDINDSHNITITNSEFDGDVASGISDAEDGFGVGFGLSIRDSSGISVEDSTFTSFTGGIVTKDSQDISISGNELWDMPVCSASRFQTTTSMISAPQPRQATTLISSSFGPVAPLRPALILQSLETFWTSATGQ